MLHKIFCGANGGVFVIKSPHGTGKTTLISEVLIKHALENNLTPIYESHRRSIARSALSGIDGMAHYEDSFGFGEECDSSGLKVVVNSAIKTAYAHLFEKSDLIVIDEAKQVLDHIVSGSVTHRAETFNAFIEQIKSTKTVILMDADINTSLIDVVRLSGRSDVSIIEMPTDRSDKTIKVGDYYVVSKKINDAVAKGFNVLAAFDVATSATAMYLKLQKDFPEKSMLLLTAENVGDEAQKAFLQNPNTECVKYDVVIYSPVITSSVSITTRHFDLNVGLFKGVLTPQNAIQQLMRDRTAIEFVAGLDNTQERDFGRDTSEKILSHISESGEEITDFDRIASQIDADAQFFKNHFESSFVLNAELEKFNVCHLKRDKDEQTHGRCLTKQAAVIEKKNYTDRILLAQPATKEMIQQAMSGHGETDSTLAVSIERARIEKTLGKTNLTKADINLWKRGALLNHIKAFELIHSGESDLDWMDRKDKAGAKRDRQYIRIRHKMYVTIFNRLGLNSFTGEGYYTAIEAQDLLDYIHSLKEEWNKLELVKCTDKWLDTSNAIKIVNRMLMNIFGLEVQSVSVMKSGVRYRKYHLNTKLFDSIISLKNFSQ